MGNTYMFEWFDELISVRLNPQKRNIAELATDEIRCLEQKADTEKEALRLILMRAVFNTEQEKAIELLIGQYQNTIIRLLNQLDQYEAGNKPDLISLYKTLTAALEELLRFIESYFTKYFDSDQKIPLPYWRICKKQVLQTSQNLRDQLLQSGQDDELVGIVIKYFLKLPPDSLGEPWTYRELAYYHAFLKALPELHLYNAFQGAGIAPLMALLIYLNFNHAAFTHYAIRRIEAFSQQNSTQCSKEEVLQHLYRTIKLMQVKPGVSYAPALPAVQHFLIQWISFELNYKPENITAIMDSHPGTTEGKKIYLSVSVAMLGLFIRLLREDDIITNKNQSELIRFFAAHFATSKQSDISSDSLHGSYFKPQPGTVRMMKECLFRMQATLTKKF